MERSLFKVFVENIAVNAFPKGVFGEILFTDVFGGKPTPADTNDFNIVKAHLTAHESHARTVDISEPFNIALNRVLADVNLFQAYVSASRIQDPKLRSQAFSLIMTSFMNFGFAFIGFAKPGN